jgi:hypothetical protein
MHGQPEAGPYSRYVMARTPVLIVLMVAGMGRCPL